ncbi:hypothetical protein ACFQJC_14915 [Haloferax namakaokahaiae]|uniref:DUF368 domain-containing protein n=1 Tax=Haloferax namakaokahaiae TaxID=1748331 RepID=A0ABD5ZIE3_9EURY
MSRYVPEISLVTGVFLGLSATLSGVVLTGRFFPSLLFGVVVCVPFAAFGVVRSEDPSEALPPRIILGIGVALGGLLLLAGLVDTPRVPFLSGLLAALLVALPTVVYATKFGADVNPLSPLQTLVASGSVGALFLAAAPLVGALSAVIGLLVGLSGALYAQARGFRPTYRQQRLGMVAGVLLGLGVASFGLAMRLPLGATTASAGALVIAPSLFVALTRAQRSA